MGIKERAFIRPNRIDWIAQATLHQLQAAIRWGVQPADLWSARRAAFQNELDLAAYGDGDGDERAADDTSDAIHDATDGDHTVLHGIVYAECPCAIQGCIHQLRHYVLPGGSS